MTVPCPQCWDLVETKVEFSAGALTYFLAILLIMFGFICFACIPCCVNVCKIITMHSLNPVSEIPMTVPCPQCNERVETEVEFVPGALAYLIALIMFLCGLIFCFCIPCCVDSCKDALHFCPRCRNCFGRYKRLNV
ncbi:hypothetical protein QR680_013652 [Steinernema hermaphroditum]|uniref:LITAF domain-containing protein n=1 Tax=Steinernema hermaphroditum TaxID=289476 RepID=A0AA39M2Q3_9BILA|nr:hypothetical protein QR680_013652 [Steinernema hermaphroditum]